MSDEMSDAVALLPCPFCGEEGWPITHSNPYTEEHSVRCESGCCEVHEEYADEAANAWNTRTPDTAKDERIAVLEGALAVGEKFVNACFSAWSCGEPEHRVRTMLDRADEFRTALTNTGASA